MHSGDAEPGRYTAAQYFGLVERGLLCPDERVELLDGLIVAMPPQTPPHAGTIAVLDDLLQTRLGADMHVRVQLSLQVATSTVPEPDLAVVPGLPTAYFTHHPTSALLVIEVAQSSVAQDRLTKAAVYAAASIPEYWIVNLRDGVVEWFAEPRGGVYRRSGTALRGQVLSSAVLTGPPIAVDEVLPPAQND